MPNFAKHIFFFLLMALIGGAVLNQQTVPQEQFFENTTMNPANQCQNALSSITASEDNGWHFDLSSESNTTDTQPKTITSCNSLLNILLSENNFTFNPGEQEIDITIYNALLSSQIFVFQEPDPPRLG